MQALGRASIFHTHTPGIVDLEIVGIVFVLPNESLFESVHLGRFPVDQDDVRRFERANKLRGLLVIRMSGKGNVFDGTVELQLLTAHRRHFFRLREDELVESEKTMNTVL